MVKSCRWSHQLIVTLSYRAWSSIIIVHEKGVFCVVFSKYLKNGRNYFDKNMNQNDGVFGTFFEMLIILFKCLLIS